MYYAPADMPARVRTMNLNEDLGQVRARRFQGDCSTHQYERLQAPSKQIVEKTTSNVLDGTVSADLAQWLLFYITIRSW